MVSVHVHTDTDINLIEKRKQPASALQIFSFCLFQNFTQMRFAQVPPSITLLIVSYFAPKVRPLQSPWKFPRDCEIRLMCSYNK